MCRDMVAESALAQSIKRAPRVRLGAAVDRPYFHSQAMPSLSRSSSGR